MSNFAHINIEDHIHSQVGSVGILSWTFDEDLYDGIDEWSDEGTQLFMDFCEEKGIHYYASPSEYFNRQEAIEKAIANGKAYVIMEDLS